MHSSLSAKVLILILASVLTLILIPQVEAATTELDYVDSFSATKQNWNTHTGNSPWLYNNESCSISAYTDHVVDAIFGFSNTTITNFATITSIKVRGQVRTNNELHYVALQIHGFIGGYWLTTYNAYGDGSNFIDFSSGDLKGIINSIAKINECRMNVTKHNVGGTGTLILMQVYLEIIYSTGAEWRSPIVWTLWTYRNWSSPVVWTDFFQRVWQSPITWTDWFYRNWTDAIVWSDFFQRDWQSPVVWESWFQRSWQEPVTWLFTFGVSGWQQAIVWKGILDLSEESSSIIPIFIGFLLILICGLALMEQKKGSRQNPELLSK